ncbi:MFS transporter [Neobacillus sp. SM06]|uniref:MFS transporter n=1 Tax=Neobacillus sp. SM06 TaxID=3422492 RepID=UPI003D2A9F2F
MISYLKEEKQYARLFLAGVINGIGDRFSSVAVLATLLYLTGSGFAVGLTLAIRLLPYLLFGPIGGKLADRFSRKTILVITDLMRIGFALSFLLVNTKEEIWIIYVSSFFLAAGEAIYAPARKSAIPQLVKKSHLVQVNSLEQVMLGIVLIGGAFSGGIVSAIFGAGVTFWFNAASFLGAAAVISTIHFPEKIMEEENHFEASVVPLKKIIAMSLPIQILLLGEVLIAAINGIDNVLISVYAVDEYHLGEAGVGLFYGVLGIGLMASFTAANRLHKHLLVKGLTAFFLEGVFLVALSRTHLVIFAVLIFGFAAFMSGISNTCFDTVLMKEIPEEQQGRIFGLMATISNTILGGSMFLAGLSLNKLPPRSLGFMGGIAFMLAASFLLAVFLVKSLHKKEGKR